MEYLSQKRQQTSSEQKIQNFNEIENMLNQNLSNLGKYCSEIEADENVHDSFYLKIKLYMKYSEAFQDSNDLEVLNKIVERIKIILKLSKSFLYNYVPYCTNSI